MRKALRKNEQTFGQVLAKGAWGPGRNGNTVNLNLEVEQVAVLAALCQKAVQEHYSFDRRDPRARRALVQIMIDYGKRTPSIVVKRERSVKNGSE